MRRSLPLRIFLVHLVFSVGAAVLAVLLVGHSFQRYKQSWEREVETLPGETLFQPLAHEVARSLLLRLEQGFVDEVKDRDRERISEGLSVVLRELPSVRSVVIVDRRGRIQYASDGQVVDLAFTGDEDASFFASTEVVRRARVGPAEERLTELLVPVFDPPAAGSPGSTRRRLGSLIVQYRSDEALTARVPQLRPPSIDTRTFVLPVVLFLATVAVSGVLIALLTGLPVRRLDRALRDFRARGFRGGLEIDGRGMRGEFASTIRAIKEMGGRLEALDAQGREREALLATLSQSLEEGMIVLDAAGAPVAWNPAALRIVGCGARREDPQPAPPGEDRERSRLTRMLERNPELTRPRPQGRLAERRRIDLLRGAGARVPLQITRVPFETRPGQQGTLLLLRDLAALGKVEAHLLEAGRFAGLAHVAAGLAHEIRNPLHAIGLNAGVVEQYVGMEATDARRQAMSESLSSIKDETRRLAELLNNYLGLVRPDPVAGPVDLTDLCRRVRRLLEYSASQAGVEIRVEGDANPPPVEGVAAGLQQAILNLVLNSIQAMPDGGVVTLETAVHDDFVQLTVADTGPGIPRERERDLFSMRATTKPRGTGLGLPLVRIIAESHGGQVSYRPRAGGGAAMVLRLPVRVAA